MGIARNTVRKYLEQPEPARLASIRSRDRHDLADHAAERGKVFASAVRSRDAKARLRNSGAPALT
jgi:hypothetical protein